MARALLPLFVLLVATVSQASVVRNFPPLEFEPLHENPNQRIATLADGETYRLPNNTEPISYDVTISTKVHTGETAFQGTVIINLEVIETSTTIVVHARQLSNFKGTIQRADGSGSVINLEHTHEAEREFLIFSANGVTFEKGTTWLLTITYEGNLRSDNGGFYLSTYTDEKGETKYLATTQFESTDARHAFPCYDEPAKRATFTITIHHDPSYNAISNMPVNAAKTSSGITSFDTTVKMSTYLVAFIVSQFVSSEGKLNDLPQRVFSRKGTENDQEWALTTGMLVEKRLSGYFDVKYALPKLDQAAIPDFAAGAMENWGLATYREEYLLYNTENSTISTQTNIATIEAHEDAHMWFGDLVAIEWWSYLWLKEGFATLFENLAVDLAYPEWNIFQTFHAAAYQSAMIADASSGARPMTYFVEKPSEISLLYDSISYAKAGCVLDMWRNALPHNIFQSGLHIYLEDHKFSSANETDLFNAIALAAREIGYEVPAAITEMMVSWTRQAGVPLLTVERNYDDGSFTVKQERYLNDKNADSSRLWFVPFNYAQQSSADFRQTTATHYLLGEQELTVSDAKTDKEDWLILNKQSTGYYRINYDAENWKLITEGLISRPHKIHPRNRAQLISDLYRFATSGRVPHSTLLELLSYMPKEDQYAPWSAANTVVTLFNRYLSSDEGYTHFQFFLNHLVNEQYDKFGVNDVHGEQHLAKYTRNVVINVACMAGLESCLSETKDKLQALVDHGTPIEPNLQSPVYCNGLKKASGETFNFVFDKLMNSNDQAERRLLISSLGCSQTESQLELFVMSSINLSNKLRTQERITLLSPTYSRGEVGLLVCIRFLIAQWEAYGNLNSGFGGVNPLYSDIVTMSAYVVTDNQKAELQKLIEVVKGSKFVPSTLQEEVDANIKANNDWLAINRDPIISWVSNFRNSSPAVSVSILAMALCLLAAKLF